MSYEGESVVIGRQYIVGIGETYATIQAAIDAADVAGGGTVVITEGSYDERLVLKDKVKLVGQDRDEVKLLKGVLINEEGTYTLQNLTISDSENETVVYIAEIIAEFAMSLIPR